MSEDDDRRPRPDDEDPLAEIFKQFMAGGGDLSAMLPPGLAGMPGVPTDPAAVQAMFAQVQQMLAGGDDGPVNWTMARDIARRTAAEGGDPSPGEQAHRQIAEALRTADMWLGRTCDLPAATARTETWSRAEWVEETLPVWKGVVEPVATSVGDALAEAMSSQAPPELRSVMGAALPMMRRMGAAFFGAQLGQAIGTLAGEVVGGGDIGLPLLAPGRAALLPTNVAAFSDGLGLSLDEVRLYLALREAAHARLMAGVPWLRAHLLSAVGEYARGIRIDTESIESAVRTIDPSDPEALRDALASGLFEPERTPAQQTVLDRLETSLALIEGWVDEVVHTAAQGSLPHADALRETIRRRRASGGPAEHTFASLVGLELRPRRLREAAAVWSALTAARGISARDALWSHPDLVPTAEAFADPEGFARVPGDEEPTSELDAALAAILETADHEAERAAQESSGGDGDAAGRPDHPDAPEDTPER